MTKTFPIKSLSLAATLAFLAVPMAAYADATLFLSSASATLGQSGKLCVSMNGSGSQIAGIQANLRWDDTCMTPTDSKRLCQAEKVTGKSVQSALQGRGALKAILISFSDVNPIPDGPLFCCDFTAVGTEGTRCPAVQITDIIGSTGKGERISGIKPGNTGVFTVLGAGQQPGAVAGGPGPDTGAGQAPAPVRQAGPPGAVVGESGSAPAQAPAVGGGPAPGARAGGPAVPGLPAQAPQAGGAEPPPQYGDNIHEPVVQPPDVPAQGIEQPAGTENLGAAGGPTTIIGTPTAAAATPTKAIPPTATPVPNTPTPIPATNTPTPESGWMGGCEMRIPR